MYVCVCMRICVRSTVQGKASVYTHIHTRTDTHTHKHSATHTHILSLSLSVCLCMGGRTNVVSTASSESAPKSARSSVAGMFIPSHRYSS
jgi:hypothetical protein